MNELLAAAGAVLSPTAILLMVTGTALGIVVGAMPGLTGAMLIALSLPLTFSMTGEHALVLLVAMYVGSVSGGLVTATLLKIPGTPASMMTTYDGFPMAQSGQGRRALGLGIHASLFGGLVGWLFLVCVAAPLAKLSLMFGPFEFFSLVMMALVLIASVSGKSLSRGMLAGGLGMLAAMPGADPATGLPRWTIGIAELDDGFKLLPVLIGLFAVSQVVTGLNRSAVKPEPIRMDEGSVRISIRELLGPIGNLIRSSFIGVFIGILPGIGANIASVVAYSTAKGMSKRPDRFGKGSEEGIIASEAANNASVGGAMIPLVAMGIPGSVIDAILLGALTVHGLQPGPLLMEQSPGVVHVIMGTMLTANLFMFGFMLLTAGWLARLSTVPRWLLTPTILTMCVLGSYALSNRMFDVWVMLGFGVVGYIMDRLSVPMAPFVIGFVLAPIAEQHLAEGLMQSGGSWLPLFARPGSLVFLSISLVTLIWTLAAHRRRHRLQASAME